jgi:hypothetical protein
MKTVEEFRAHAEHCRMLAKKSHTRDERQKYNVMADGWESLAVERARRLKLSEDDTPPTASD